MDKDLELQPLTAEDFVQAQLAIGGGSVNSERNTEHVNTERNTDSTQIL